MRKPTTTKPRRGAAEIDAKLDQLFPVKAGIEEDREAVWLDRDLLKPGPWQYRKIFKATELRELGESMRTIKQNQHILVTPEREGGKETGMYWIIAGERRWRAAAPEYGNCPKVRCVIRDRVTPYEAQRLALSENIDRKDVDPVSMAIGWRKMKAAMPGRNGRPASDDDVARELGKQRVTVSRYFALLRLDPKLQDKIAEQGLSEKHGRALVLLNTGDEVGTGDDAYHKATKEQTELLARIQRDELSGDDAVAIATQLKERNEQIHQSHQAPPPPVAGSKASPLSTPNDQAGKDGRKPLPPAKPAPPLAGKAPTTYTERLPDPQRELISPAISNLAKAAQLYESGDVSPASKLGRDLDTIIQLVNRIEKAAKPGKRA